MSSYIDCVLDTEPMAEQIDSVSNHLVGTTAAVVGMKAAVIKAEQEAADHVCANVNRGFYTLIHSQITQKMAKLNSEVESHLLKLGSLASRLLSIKTRMEHDYSLVANRYTSLFGTLNKNLKTRIAEIDRPTFDLVMRDASRMTVRNSTLTAVVPVAQTESIVESQKIIASNLKYQGQRAIDTMQRFLENSQVQAETTSRILVDYCLSKPSNTLSMPVIISEYVCDSNETSQRDIYMSDVCLNPDTVERIAEVAKQQLQIAEWHEAGEDKEVRSEFMKLMENEGLPKKVKETTLKLFSQHSYQTITH